MNGYLSGHAILSSGVRGRKGSYRKGEKARRRREGSRGGGGERDGGGLTEGGRERKRQREEGRREGTIRSSYHPLA